MSSRWIAFKWMYVLFWRSRNWCWLRKRLTEDKHLSQKTKLYLFTQLCTFSIFPGEWVPCIWAAVVPMLSSINAFFKWQPEVFMKPLVRLRTDYNPVQMCGHPPSATHSEKDPSSSGSTLWRAMFLFWQLWPASSHASANMLNIQTPYHKEEVTGRQTSPL